MTIQQLVDKANEVGIPLDWELNADFGVEYFAVKGITVNGQGEVGLVFEDHQRIAVLSKDPEEYSIPIPY